MNDIIKILTNKYSDIDGYACFKELSNSKNTSYIDLYVIGYWKGNRGATCFEIKHSRADAIKDIENFEKKQKFAMDISNELYYICPSGIIKPDEVPEKCGLYYVDKNNRMRKMKQAQKREIVKMDFELLQSTSRRCKIENKKIDYPIKFLGKDITENDMAEYFKNEIDKMMSYEIDKLVRIKLQSVESLEGVFEKQLVELLALINGKQWFYNKKEIKKVAKRELADIKSAKLILESLKIVTTHTDLMAEAVQDLNKIK